MDDPSLPRGCFQLVIFDFDGTLADTYPWFFSIFDELAEHYHLPRVEKSALEALRKVDIQNLSREYKISFVKVASQIEHIPLVDGLQTVINRLHWMGMKMAVVSSNAGENVRQVLGARNAAYCDAFECGVSLLAKGLNSRKYYARPASFPTGH